MSLVSRYLDPVLIERLNHLQLSARQVVAGSTLGQHRSPVKGASIEFRQHRVYVPGDEPRRLDWRVFGRTDRPYVKEYDEETNLRCLVLLDGSGSMAYGRKSGTKYDFAASLAASLAYLMLGQTESVGLAVFRKRIEAYLAPHGGRGQLAKLIDVLERSGPRGESSLSAALHDAGNRLDRRALIIVISDFFTPVERIRDGMAHLKHDRHELIALRVLDRDEIEFPFRRWSRFRGLEGEPAQLCEPALARKTYMERFQDHQHELEARCAAMNVEQHAFVTDVPLADGMERFLRGRIYQSA
jgi:uncharacterized protein (DUF58 family)